MSKLESHAKASISRVRWGFCEDKVWAWGPRAVNGGGHPELYGAPSGTIEGKDAMHEQEPMISGRACISVPPPNWAT